MLQMFPDSNKSHWRKVRLVKKKIQFPLCNVTVTGDELASEFYQV